MAEFVVERWGTSPAVAFIELFNEVDMADDLGLHLIRAIGRSTATGIRQLQAYRGRPVCQSFALAKGEPVLDSSDAFHLTTSHVYQRGRQATAATSPARRRITLQRRFVNRAAPCYFDTSVCRFIHPAADRFVQQTDSRHRVRLQRLERAISHARRRARWHLGAGGSLAPLVRVQAGGSARNDTYGGNRRLDA